MRNNFYLLFLGMFWGFVITRVFSSIGHSPIDCSPMTFWDAFQLFLVLMGLAFISIETYNALKEICPNERKKR